MPTTSAAKSATASATASATTSAATSAAASTTASASWARNNFAEVLGRVAGLDLCRGTRPVAVDPGPQRRRILVAPCR